MLPSDTDHERTPIEVGEIVGFGLAAAALLIVITEVGTAVMAAFSSPGIASGSSIGVGAIPGPSDAETLRQGDSVGVTVLRVVAARCPGRILVAVLRVGQE